MAAPITRAHSSSALNSNSKDKEFWFTGVASPSESSESESEGVEDERKSDFHVRVEGFPIHFLQCVLLGVAAPPSRHCLMDTSLVPPSQLKDQAHWQALARSIEGMLGLTCSEVVCDEHTTVTDFVDNPIASAAVAASVVGDASSQQQQQQRQDQHLVTQTEEQRLLYTSAPPTKLLDLDSISSSSSTAIKANHNPKHKSRGDLIRRGGSEYSLLDTGGDDDVHSNFSRFAHEYEAAAPVDPLPSGEAKGPIFSNVVVVRNADLLRVEVLAVVLQAMKLRNISVRGTLHRMPKQHCVVVCLSTPSFDSKHSHSSSSSSFSSSSSLLRSQNQRATARSKNTLNNSSVLSQVLDSCCSSCLLPATFMTQVSGFRVAQRLREEQAEDARETRLSHEGYLTHIRVDVREDDSKGLGGEDRSASPSLRGREGGQSRNASVELDLEAQGPASATVALDLSVLRRSLPKVFVSGVMLQYSRDLVTAIGQHPSVLVGPSSTARADLIQASKLFALISGVAFVRPVDIQGVVANVLAHRVTLKTKAVARFNSHPVRRMHYMRGLIRDIMSHILPDKGG